MSSNIIGNLQVYLNIGRTLLASIGLGSWPKSFFSLFQERSTFNQFEAPETRGNQSDEGYRILRFTSILKKTVSFKNRCVYSRLRYYYDRNSNGHCFRGEISSNSTVYIWRVTVSEAVLRNMMLLLIANWSQYQVLSKYQPGICAHWNL